MRLLCRPQLLHLQTGPMNSPVQPSPSAGGMGQMRRDSGKHTRTSGPFLRALSSLSVCPSFSVSTDLQGISTECKAIPFLLPQFPLCALQREPHYFPRHSQNSVKGAEQENKRLVRDWQVHSTLRAGVAPPGSCKVAVLGAGVLFQLPKGEVLLLQPQPNCSKTAPPPHPPTSPAM